jgi:hypothetical protein
LGLKAGIRFSNHSYKIEDFADLSTKPLFGYQFGIWINNQLSEKFDISSGIAYSLEGFEFDLNPANPLYDTFKVPISFLNLNSSIVYKITDAVKCGTGPELGYFISSKWIIDGNKSEMDEYKKFALGWNFSLLYDFTFPVLIELRYHQGLHNISTDSIAYSDGFQVYESSVKEVKRNLQFNIYYSF